MDFIELSIEVVTFLFFVAVFAGTVDTLAGGGGLITVPALLIAGISPLQALATNKIQGGTGTAIASLMMLRQGKITWKTSRIPMLMSFVGAALGTATVHSINTDALSCIIPLVLAIIGGYFLMAPMISKLQIMQHRSKQAERSYNLITIPCIGFYDGMFGPGAGSFFTLGGVALRQDPIVVATANAKALNFASNVASVVLFLISGKVVWAAGLVMMLGQTLGAWLGSHLLNQIDPNLLRWLIVLICFAVLMKYIMDA